MYYTSRSIKLANRYLAYLELIQTANNRYKNHKDDNSLSEHLNKSLPSLYPYLPMNYRFNEQYMERMKELSSWLVIRMQSVITELNEVNIAQLKKELSNNEVSTIEL